MPAKSRVVKENSLPSNATRQRPWQQLAFVLGEAALSLAPPGVLFIIISRVGGPILLGTYALAFAWLLLFQGVSSFGIPELLMREVGAHGRAAAGQVVHAMVVGLASGCVAMGAMAASVRLVGYPAEVVQVITIASLALLPASLNTISRAVFLSLRLMHLTFAALLVEVTIVMIVSLYLLFSGYGAVALMMTLIAAKLASASTSLLLLYGRVLPVRPRLSAAVLRHTAATVFTFGIGSMLGMLTIRINTIMVSMWVDLAGVGHYAAATKIMEIALIPSNIASQLLLTRIAFNFNGPGRRDPNRFAAWYRAFFAITVPAAVGIWVFAGLILQALFGPGFDNAVWVLRILMIYFVMESVDTLMSIILQAAHQQRQDVARLAFNPLVNIALNLALLPSLGVVGAAIGRLGGSAVSLTLRYVLIGRSLTQVNWLRLACKPALISGSAGLACYALFGVARATWLVVLYAAFTSVLLALTATVSPAVVKDMMSLPSGDD